MIIRQEEFMTRSHSRSAEGKVLPIAVSQGLFLGAITRERKRTERSGFAILLFMISIGECGQKSNSSEVWNDVAEALSAVKSEIDVLGWFEQSTTMGLLCPDIHISHLAT